MDRLESSLKGHLLVIRLDINSPMGKYVRQKYSNLFVPGFIVIDKMGNEVWRIAGIVPSVKTILSLDAKYFIIFSHFIECQQVD